jgi:hypothetical protein
MNLGNVFIIKFYEQGGNSQLGPMRLTTFPFGQTFPSWLQAHDCPDELLFLTCLFAGLHPADTNTKTEVINIKFLI